MLKRIVFLFIATNLIIFSLYSCAKNDGRAKLCDFLFSQNFEAEFDFSFIDDNGNEIISGSAKAFKNGKARIEFLSPEPLSSLTVESDEKGDAGVLIFNYYGMRTPLADGALTKVSALLGIFSDELPRKVTSHEAKVFPKSDGEKSLAECVFSLDGEREISIVFDKIGGFPEKIVEKREDFTITVTFTKITPADLLRETT